MSPRAKKAVFIGYPPDKVWLIDDKKCVISRDIVINEFAFYKIDLHELKFSKKSDEHTGYFPFEVKNLNKSDIQDDDHIDHVNLQHQKTQMET